jgi:hypothetical protein
MLRVVIASSEPLIPVDANNGYRFGCVVHMAIRCLTLQYRASTALLCLLPGLNVPLPASRLGLGSVGLAN